MPHKKTGQSAPNGRSSPIAPFTRARSAPARGYNLVELLVVLLVLGLLLSLALPSWSAWRLRQQLQAQADHFWNALLLARSQALLLGQHVTVCTAAAAARQCDASLAWHEGWLVFVDPNRNGQIDAGERLLQQQPPIAGVRIAGNSTVTHHIGYASDGRSASLSGGFQAGTVSVCASGLSQGWRVVINAMGRPRLESQEISDCP